MAQLLKVICFQTAITGRTGGLARILTKKAYRNEEIKANSVTAGNEAYANRYGFELFAFPPWSDILCLFC